MKHRIWESRAATLIGRVFSLGLILFLFIYLQGAVVRAAVPESAGDAASLPSSLKAVTVGKMEGELEKVYFPLVLNSYSTEYNFIEAEDLIISTLEVNTIDHWTMDLIAGDVITVSAAPGAMVDIVLSITDEGGTSVVDKQNLSPAGEVETIADLTISEPGYYDLLVSTEQGETTDYALMFLDANSYNFVLQGTFFDNGSQSDSLLEETDHFWFFNALSGESVSFTITPDLDSDPYVELYDPAAERILILDNGLAGEPESLENYTLLDSGLYGIRIGEFDFLVMDYQISVSKP